MTEELKINDNTKEISKELVDKKTEKDYITFAKELENKKKAENTKEVTEAFNDHADEVLEGIKDNMINNFASIDANKLSDYEKAKTAFDTDINDLITHNTPTPEVKVEKEIDTKTSEVKEKQVDDVYYTPNKTKEQTKNKEAGTPKQVEKLNTLLDITKEIGYIIQLKKLESGEEPGNDFDAGKLLNFVKENAFEKKYPPKIASLNITTWESLINVKNKTVQENNKTKKDEETKNNKEKSKVELGKDQLNVPNTPEFANKLFETGPKENFEAAFDLIHGQSDTTDNVISGKTIIEEKDDTKTKQTNAMIKLLQTYNNGKEVSPENVFFGHAQDIDPKNEGTDKTFAPEYPSNTPIIEIGVGTKIEENKIGTINGMEFTNTKEEKTILEEEKDNIINGITFKKNSEVITATKDDIIYNYDATTKKFTNSGKELNLSDFNMGFDGTNTITKSGGMSVKKDNIIYNYDATKKKFTNSGKELNLSDFNMGFDGTNTITTKQRVVRGTKEYRQGLKAEKYGIDFNNISTWKSGTLNTFDGKGNFKTFEKCLQTKGSPFVKDNLGEIMKDVVAYKAEKGTSDFNENPDSLRNGYATALTNFMISDKADSALLETYLNYLTPATISYLGVDKATQTKNFDALVASNKFKTLKLADSVRDNLLNIKLNIMNTNKATVQEQIKSGFDALLKSRGGLIMDIIELFGGKGALRSFCSKFGINYDKYFKELEKMYDDKYTLNDGQKTLLKNAYDASESNKRAAAEDEEGDIQYSKKNIVTYYSEQFKTPDNFKLLDPTLVERAMKETKVGNANVIISEKGSNGKTEKKINDKNNLTSEEIGKIVDYIIKGEKDAVKGNPEIRNKVKEAGEAITQTDSVYNTERTTGKEKPKMKAEREKAEKNKKIKGFTDATDIGIYFGAYLMKGSKDLKYTISQTELPFEDKNEKKISKDNKNSKEEENKQQAKNEFDTKSLELITKINKYVDKKTGKYGAFETYTFTGTEATNDTDAIKYKTDILIPFKELFFTGTTTSGSEKLSNYNLFLEKIGKKSGGDKDENDKLMTTIKNMLLMTQNVKTKEHQAVTNAITRGNTYETSTDGDNLVFKVKNTDKTKDIGTITLGVVNGQITTKREATKTTNSVVKNTNANNNNNNNNNTTTTSGYANPRNPS